MTLKFRKTSYITFTLNQERATRNAQHDFYRGNDWPVPTAEQFTILFAKVTDALLPGTSGIGYKPFNHGRRFLRCPCKVLKEFTGEEKTWGRRGTLGKVSITLRLTDGLHEGPDNEFRISNFQAPCIKRLTGEGFVFCLTTTNHKRISNVYYCGPHSAGSLHGSWAGWAAWLSFTTATQNMDAGPDKQQKKSAGSDGKKLSSHETKGEAKDVTSTLSKTSMSSSSAGTNGSGAETWAAERPSTDRVPLEVQLQKIILSGESPQHDAPPGKGEQPVEPAGTDGPAREPAGDGKDVTPVRRAPAGPLTAEDARLMAHTNRQLAAEVKALRDELAAVKQRHDQRARQATQTMGELQQELRRTQAELDRYRCRQDSELIRAGLPGRPPAPDGPPSQGRPPAQRRRSPAQDSRVTYLRVPDECFPAPASKKPMSALNIDDVMRTNQRVLDENEVLRDEVQQLRRDNSALLRLVKWLAADNRTCLNHIHTSVTDRRDLTKKLHKEKTEVCLNRPQITSNGSNQKAAGHAPAESACVGEREAERRRTGGREQVEQSENVVPYFRRFAQSLVPYFRRFAQSLVPYFRRFAQSLVLYFRRFAQFLVLYFRRFAQFLVLYFRRFAQLLVLYFRRFAQLLVLYFRRFAQFFVPYFRWFAQFLVLTSGRLLSCYSFVYFRPFAAFSVSLTAPPCFVPRSAISPCWGRGSGPTPTPSRNSTPGRSPCRHGTIPSHETITWGRDDPHSTTWARDDPLPTRLPGHEMTPSRPDYLCTR
uniref:Uncharacterized protein n=1 Tax=Branchiostoma floridae TaxID=7739 RepID=C3ZWL7_BRAFL|eukprot:XP_002587075.1 hypothetical protein BRAFLDRAFT_102997 [Branchiostoma floridae]